MKHYLFFSRPIPSPCIGVWPPPRPPRDEGIRAFRITRHAVSCIRFRDPLLRVKRRENEISEWRVDARVRRNRFSRTFPRLWRGVARLILPISRGARISFVHFFPLADSSWKWLAETMERWGVETCRYLKIRGERK